MQIIKLKDPVSGLTHALGALLAVAGLAALVAQGVRHGTVWHVVSYAIYGASLIMLYSASAIYHLFPVSEATGRILRRMDHMMIYVLIAGTYTPFCLVPLRGVWGWTIFGVIWGCALGGFALKIFWMNAPRWLYTGIYLAMGWLIVVAGYPLAKATSSTVLFWMVAGGLFYSLGAVLYATKWPKLWPPVFGFHELWHLFVLAGSAAHFVAVWNFL